MDEVGVDVDEAGHALAARRDETELGDGLHLVRVRVRGRGRGRGRGS